MQNKPILKILAILIALLIFVSSAALSIAVDDSTINTSDRLDEMPFYKATIHVQHSQQSDHKIHIGYQPSTHQIAAILAADKGWWEEDLRKFGIENVIMTKFPSGPPEMTAMLAGDLDVAYVGVAPPIAAMYEGLDAKIVAGVQTQGSALVVLPELADEYEGPASLKGKTIATFPPGSIQHTVLSKWLLDNGIAPEGDVNIKAMGPSEATAAIGYYKAVDAAFLPSPYPTIIEVAGNGVIVEWSGSIWPNHACCCVVASGEMIREHPEIVKQIIKTHIRATEYEIAHPNEAAEIYAQRHGADVSTIKRSINVSDMQWIHDPHLEVESGINYAAVIYDLNRERYEGRGVEVFEEEDIFDTSFYDEIRSVIPDVNAKSSIEWHTSDQNAMQIARSQNKPTMIFFYSDRCPASLKQKEVFSDTLVINMSKNFIPIVGSRELDTQYGIRYVPTIVFTNSQGEEVYRTVGYRDADTLVNEMQYALSLSTTLDVPFFSQRDPAWCDKKLDHSPYSIGKYGCALTSAAMVAKYFGYDTNPDRLNTSLTEVGGLDASGILYWKNVEEVSGGKVEWIGKAEGNWSRIDQELGNKNPVIADVSCSLGKHFIVFIGKNETEYYHLDPYDENRTVNKWPNGVHGEYTLNNLRIYHKGRRPGIASAQDVLRLDEHRSYVWTETGEKIPYVDFLNTDQLEGDILEFRIYVSKTGVPIPDNYVLELRTNMDKPRDWKFGEDIYHSASVIVWQGKNEHAYPFPSPIILTGVVPEPIRQVKEPGFEKYTIEGIGKDEVYVELTVGTSRDGATLETIQQKLSPSMNFFSTSEGIKAAKREIEKNLEEARGKIGRTDLEEDIWALYEEGHPGWASKLSAHYKELIMERFENYFAEEEPTKFTVEVRNPAGAYICNDSVDYTFGRNLKRGDRGDDVKYLQIVLNANLATQVAVDGPGSPCHETNYFGVLTEAAVIKFQTLHEGLTQSGELDEATRAELNKLYLPVKHVPNGWVLSVTNTHQNEEIQDGCVWWEVEDVTDCIKGWVADQKISGEAKYLEVGDQEELKNRVKKLKDDARIPMIRQEVTEHRTEFLPANFPLGLILAMAIQESGGDGFDNEIVALTPWGRGIMQIDTDNYVGAGSGIRWYNNGAVDYCRGKEGHGCTCSAGICYCEACKHYYTNTTQGIEANIKDGLYVLRDKYICQCCYDKGKDAEWDVEEGLYREEMGGEVIFYSREEECKGSDGHTYDSRIEKIKIGNVQISCSEFKVIDAVWRYNGRSIYPVGSCMGNDYLRCVADKLNEIKRTFGYEMPNKDTWIESLKAVSRSASVMKKIK